MPANLERAAGWSWRLLVCAAVVVAMAAAPPVHQRDRHPGDDRADDRTGVDTARGPATKAAAGTAGGGAGPHRRVLVLAGLIAVVTTSVLAQYDELRDSVTRAVDDITDRLEGEPFNLSLSRTEDLQASLSDSWGQLSSYLATGVQAGIGFLAGLILAVALLYFVLRDGAELWQWLLRRLPPESRPAADRAGKRAWDVLGGFIRGTVIIAAIDAVLIGLGLWLLGVPLAFALAVVVFLGAFVPFVGAFVSGLIAVLVAFADEGWEIALLALALVIAVQLVEGNFLQPIIQSRTVDLHPAVILLAVAAGASLFGILGAYLAVPVTAVVFAVVASLESDSDVSAS